MSSEYRRRQLRVGHPSQLFHPDQLGVGKEIALVVYSAGNPAWMRSVLALSGFLLAKLRTQSPRQQLAAAAEGWKEGGGYQPLLTRWRGVVEGIGDTSVMVLCTHGRAGLDGIERFARPEEILPLANPDDALRDIISFTELGLMPVPEGELRAGHWLLNVTLAMPAAV